MSFHSRISPSKLHQVELCPGSVRATENSPRRSNKAAAEGTMLHEIAAECLEQGFEPHDYLGRTYEVEGFSFTTGFEEGQIDPLCMIDGLDWLREQPGELFIEKRVFLDPYMPGQSGSMDVGIYTPEVATVFDWKFGAGVLVQTQGNRQALGYAKGFQNLINELGWPMPPKWRIVIEQPRAPGGARYYDAWEIPVEELDAFGDTLAAIWAAANDPDAQRVAGEKQCMFCTAKDEPGGCDAYNRFNLDLIGLTFEDLDATEGEPVMPDHGKITPERRSYLVRHSAMITRWIKKLHADTLVDALSGRPTPGLKAVSGRAGHRYYTDPEAATEILVGALADDAFTMELKSPAKVENIMKPGRKRPGHPEAWERLLPLIGQKEGKPSLVPLEDPRPALTAAIDNFDNLDLDDSTDE